EQGLFDEAWRHLEQANELLAEHGDGNDMAQLHREQAEIFEGRGDGLAADSLYAAALIGFREASDNAEEARTLQWWGSSLLRRKDQERALVKLESSLGLWEAADDLGGLADTHRSLANFYSGILGDRPMAWIHAEQALDYARKMPDKVREAHALLITCDLRFGDGEMDGSLADQQRAIELYREAGNEQETLDALTGLGSLLSRRGEFELSMTHFGQTLDRAEAGGFQSSIAWALDRRAWVGHLIGRNAQAKIDVERCIQIYRELGNELGESSAINTLASIEQAQGDYDAALAHFEEYHVIAESWGDNGSLAAYHNNVGELHISLGEYEKAAEHLRHAIDYGERVQYFTAITAASANLARVHLQLDQHDEA
ncbi:MAG: tetratricopeptide repeat protein, partial [bacterium]|nr:tetratricopeptide repeat protein [bacterium]